MAVDVLEGLLEEDDEVVQVRFKKKEKILGIEQNPELSSCLASELLATRADHSVVQAAAATRPVR